MTWCNDDVIRIGLAIAFLVIFLEEGLGIYPFGHDPRLIKENLAFQEGQQTASVPLPEGDEHTR